VADPGSDRGTGGNVGSGFGGFVVLGWAGWFLRVPAGTRPLQFELLGDPLDAHRLQCGDRGLDHFGAVVVVHLITEIVEIATTERTNAVVETLTEFRQTLLRPSCPVPLGLPRAHAD